MAKKVSENNIHSITEDWGRDTSNDLPYSGAAVQKFIKDTFDTKVGCFYYDVSSNRYLVFANESKKNEYINNPTLTELVIGTFDAPFNYEANITLLTPQYNAIFLGSTGNYIDFTFDVKNKSGNSTGENVNVTYTFIRNATKRVINETRRYGETVHMNIDEYLLEGTNTVIIGIQGQTSLAATTASITYQVINLSFQDEMNISKVYDLSKGNQTVEVFFNVSGYGTKIVEWFLDGEQLPFIKSEDEVIDVTSSRTKYIELSNLANGIHTLQSRAYTIINGEKFYTDTLYRELMVTSGNNNDNMLAIATTLPHSHGLVSTQNALTLYGAEQYIPYTIRFATRKSGDVLITLDDNVLTTLHATAGSEVNYTLTYNKAGVLKLSFAGNGVNREVPISINNTSLNIEEITTQLTFDFNANGKSNSAVDKDVWSYGNYTGTFSGFNWNATSGWVNNALLLNSGASFSVDIQPLIKDATSTGKTLEFEFSTQNVENDNAVVCDLTVNGVGLKITASEARITSAAGEYVNTKFKAGEVNRIAFVINRKTSVTYKGLVFIYVNGILSGAINYGSADNFLSSATLSFHGTDDAQVSLRSMRFYDTALSADNILNNYILYRDTLIEMMEVYYRNDIYEIGTSNFSVDLLAHYLPVMIIVGDIPTLEAATSTSTQILVDIQFIHEQDPTKSFTMKRVALRIQGTSSLAYPRKNFRFYTRVEESSLVYDYEGNLIPDKLYQFIDNAQPVDCWCLKADFAESSGTHNTGIARIWNKVMYGAIIQHTNILGEETNGYALRTEAQKIALEQDYKNDVRTTIDGFPIVLFYKQKESDTDLIFLGKYNFNNDKSTPSVFGFENIPGFNNARMQCWETKDNGHPLGLFTDVSNFDRDWSEAFESRYPDTKTPNTADLKAFSQWMSTVSQEDFATQKWAHMDVYKVAAYYVYLMRFGAVDQPVKNGFLTSEDGERFYYINYDNDTINGLINTGELRLDPTITRQTIGTDGEYVYAGHSSVLWNRCEADTEFMDIVSIVDNALYSAGLRYDEVMSVFNDEQCDKWAERVYNQDAEYKYLLPYVNQATNNLFMLQGSRSSHRSWWLSKRFALYDSLFVSGAYRDRNVSFKCLNDTQPGQKFIITAGTDMNYGYGVNNGIRETGVELNSGDAHTFTTTDTLNLGDVVKIFGASDLAQLDLSQLASRLAVLDCSAASDTVLGSKMKKLLIGGNGNVNTELSSISGINKLTSLQELNIEDYQAITSLDLTALKDMRKVYAHGSGIASIDFAPGTPVEYLELPSAMMALDLQQLPYITADNIVLESGFENINSLNVIGCPKLSNNFDFVKDWVNNKTASDSQSTLIMDNVDWMNIDTEEFLEFSQHKANGLSLDLRGKVYLSSLTLDQATQLQAIWGDDCFDKNVDFRITAPDALYINPGSATINEGESIQFSCVLLSSTEGSITYSIAGGTREGAALDTKTGLFTTIENGANDNVMYIRATYTSNEGRKVSSTATISIRKRIYPTSNQITIEGATIIGSDETYSWSISSENVNGDMVAEWSLDGTAFTGGYVALIDTSYSSCIVQHLKFAEKGQSVSGELTLTLKKKIDGTVVATKSKSFSMTQLNYPTASNTSIAGDAEPKPEGSVYTWTSTATGNIGPISVAWSLDESLQAFFEITDEVWDENNPLQGSCKVTKVFDSDFYAKANLNLTITYVNTGTSFTVKKQIVVMSENLLMTSETNSSVLAVLNSAGLCANNTYMTKTEAAAVTNGQLGTIFKGKTTIENFEEFEYFTSITEIPSYAFQSCTKLAKIKFPPNIVSIGSYAFYGTKLVSIDFSELKLLTTLSGNAFYSCKSLEEVRFNESLTTILDNCFAYCEKLRNVSFPNNLQTIGVGAFRGCDSFDSATIPDSVTSVDIAAFEECLNLKTVHIGKNTSIVGRVFTGCPSLENITVSEENSQICSDELNGVFSKDKTVLYVGGVNTIMHEGLMEISEYCFYGRNVSRIVLPSTVERIEDYAFRECLHLKNINFPQGLKYIGDCVFYECDLERIDLPNDVAFFGEYQFYGNNSLKEVDLKNLKITELCGCMFYNCANLSNITLPETTEIINNSFLNSCVALKNIVIPSKVKKIYDYAFSKTSLETIVFEGETAPTIEGAHTFANLTPNASLREIYIPVNSTGYDNSWINNLVNTYGFVVKVAIEPTECTSLNIIADNVDGRSIKTNIHWTATVNGENIFTGEYCGGVVLNGTVISDTFPQNVSETETVERTISFTYMGVTATTKIVHGVWLNYFGVEALEDGLTVTCKIGDLEYCIDNGSEWVTLKSDSPSEPINTGHSLFLKGEPLTYPASFDSVRLIFSKKCNIKGNVTSIREGNNFNEVTVPHNNMNYHALFTQCTTIVNASELILPFLDMGNGDYRGMFKDCTSLVTAPELPATTLSDYCYSSMFRGCTSLTTAPVLRAESLAKSCYNYMFDGCAKLNNITMLAKNIGNESYFTNWVNGVSNTGTFYKSYMANLPFGESGIPVGWEVVNDITITECKSLTITADDVSGNDTSTMIYFTAIVNGHDGNNNIIEDVVYEGTASSDEFPQNLSETETVEREISFTYMGVTATTTIIQGVYVSKYYELNLNNQWQLSVNSAANPDSTLYDGMYESFSNKGSSSTAAICYIDIFGYVTFRLYIRSYAEGTCDYVMVSQLDQIINNSTSPTDTSLVKAHTSGNQHSGTSLSDYTLVEFTNIGGGDHRITIVYRKDGSQNEGDDRGYLLIPKNQ